MDRGTIISRSIYSVLTKFDYRKLKMGNWREHSQQGMLETAIIGTISIRILLRKCLVRTAMYRKPRAATVVSSNPNGLPYLWNPPSSIPLVL